MRVDAPAGGASLRAEDRATRTGEEAGFEQERHRVALADWIAVEAFDGQTLGTASTHVLHERRERGPQPRLVGVAKWQQRPATALHVEHRLTAEQDDLRAGDSGCAAVGTLGPGQCRAVRLRRIGGGEDE